MSVSRDGAERARISRLPAPSLFVGPPSRNASNISLHGSSKDATKPPLTRQRSRLGQASANGDKNESPDTPTDMLAPSGFTRRTTAPTAKPEQMSNERTDALWAEMQNTLEEVELNASNGTHVFGPGHSRALEELRTAQIALAQAWAKSEAEDESGTTPKVGRPANPAVKPLNAADVLATDRNAKLDNGGHGSKHEGKTQLEEDTEKDIALARQRREENDKYFQKVNQGVLDVVQKLENVAKAMKTVELESKEIWVDRDSVDTASVT